MFVPTPQRRTNAPLDAGHPASRDYHALAYIAAKLAREETRSGQ